MRRTTDWIEFAGYRWRLVRPVAKIATIGQKRLALRAGLRRITEDEGTGQMRFLPEVAGIFRFSQVDFRAWNKNRRFAFRPRACCLRHGVL